MAGVERWLWGGAAAADVAAASGLPSMLMGLPLCAADPLNLGADPAALDW